MSNTQKQLEENFLLAAFLLESQNYKFSLKCRIKLHFFVYYASSSPLHVKCKSLEHGLMETMRRIETFLAIKMVGPKNVFSYKIPLVFENLYI